MDFKKKAITVAAFLACFNASVLAQNVKMHLNGVTVKTAMHTLKQQSGYSFVFEASAMNTNKIINVNATTLNEAVKRLPLTNILYRRLPVNQKKSQAACSTSKVNP